MRGAGVTCVRGGGDVCAGRGQAYKTGEEEYDLVLKNDYNTNGHTQVPAAPDLLRARTPATARGIPRGTLNPSGPHPPLRRLA